MESIDGKRRLRGENKFMQQSRARQGCRCLRAAQPPLREERDGFVVRGRGQVGKPGIDSRAHLLRRLARECQGEDRTRRGAGQQQAQHARGQ